jgi:hypothetical protein
MTYGYKKKKGVNCENFTSIKFFFFLGGGGGGGGVLKKNYKTVIFCSWNATCSVVGY